MDRSRRAGSTSTTQTPLPNVAALRRAARASIHTRAEAPAAVETLGRRSARQERLRSRRRRFETTSPCASRPSGRDPRAARAGTRPSWRGLSAPRRGVQPLQLGGGRAALSPSTRQARERVGLRHGGLPRAGGGCSRSSSRTRVVGERRSAGPARRRGARIRTAREAEQRKERQLCGGGDFRAPRTLTAWGEIRLQGGSGYDVGRRPSLSRLDRAEAASRSGCGAGLGAIVKNEKPSQGCRTPSRRAERRGGLLQVWRRQRRLTRASRRTRTSARAPLGERSRSAWGPVDEIEQRFDERVP